MAQRLYAEWVLDLVAELGYEPKEWEQIGKARWTPDYEWQRLRYHKMENVPLKALPPKVVTPTSSEGIEDLGKALSDWWLLMYNIKLQKWKDAGGEESGKPRPDGSARIEINSAFRYLGKHVSWRDPDGVVDSSDRYGHWSGNAVDISKEGTGANFGISADEVRKAAVALGIIRKYEPWHFFIEGQYVTLSPEKKFSLQITYNIEKWEYPYEGWWPFVEPQKEESKGRGNGGADKPSSIRINIKSGGGPAESPLERPQEEISEFDGGIPGKYGVGYYRLAKIVAPKLRRILGLAEVPTVVPEKTARLREFGVPRHAAGILGRKQLVTTPESWYPQYLPAHTPKVWEAVRPYGAAYETELARTKKPMFGPVSDAFTATKPFGTLPPVPGGPAITAVPGGPAITAVPGGPAITATPGGPAVTAVPQAGAVTVRRRGRPERATPRALGQTAPGQRRTVNQGFGSGAIIINATAVDVESIKRVVSTIGKKVTAKPRARHRPARRLPEVRFPEWRGREGPDMARFRKPVAGVGGLPGLTLAEPSAPEEIEKPPVRPSEKPPVKQFFAEKREKIRPLWEGIKGLAKKVTSPVKEFFEETKEKIRPIWEGIKGLAENVTSPVEEFIEEKKKELDKYVGEKPGSPRAAVLPVVLPIIIAIASIFLGGCKPREEPEVTEKKEEEPTPEPEKPAPKTEVVVIIRPGGPNSQGVTSGIYEDVITTKVAERMDTGVRNQPGIKKEDEGDNYLEKHGWEAGVKLSVKRLEKYAGLRVALIEIHCNGVRNETVRGTETIYGLKYTKELADRLHNSVLATMEKSDRIYKDTTTGEDDFWQERDRAKEEPIGVFSEPDYNIMNPDVCKDYGMTTEDFNVRYYPVIVELGFLSNREDEQRLINSDIQQDLGAALANAVLGWVDTLQPLASQSKKPQNE